jgi:hypothetical protein
MPPGQAVSVERIEHRAQARRDAPDGTTLALPWVTRKLLQPGRG